MDEFELDILYKGEQVLLPCTLMVIGYTHKIQVEVNGTLVFFEPDEERNYRAVVEQQHQDKIDIAFLQTIAAALQESFS